MNILEKIINDRVRANPNLLINGNFDIWQRGTSLGAAEGLRFLADRYYQFSTTTTAAVSRQDTTLGDVPGSKYFIRHVISTGGTVSSQAVLAHAVESILTLAGKTATISFYAKADASKNISIEFYQNFGTGGSPSSNVSEIGVKKFAIGTTWQKINHTVEIPSIAGKTLGTSGDDRLIVIIWFDAGSNHNARTDSLGNQSGTFDIAQVKLEEGSIATPFVLSGGTVAGESTACQRYYNRIPISSIVSLGTGAAGMRAQINISPEMRRTPTPSLSHTSIEILGEATSVGSTITFSSLSPKGGRLNIDGFSSLTAYKAYAYSSTSQFIIVEAEIY